MKKEQDRRALFPLWIDSLGVSGAHPSPVTPSPLPPLIAGALNKKKT